MASTPIPLELNGFSSKAKQVISGPQTIYAYSAASLNAYPVYLKFYDKIGTTVNPATDVPALVITIPAATLVGPGLAINDNVAVPFTTAISVRCTVSNQDNDTIAPATSPDLEIQLDQSAGGGGGTGNVSNSGAPSSGQLALWTGATIIQGVTTLPDANTPALTGNVTKPAGSSVTTIATIPANTTVAGAIRQTATAAPPLPAGGTASVYVDATSKALSVINDLGVVSHTVQSTTAVANQFVTGVSDDGSVTMAQPTMSGVSGSVASTQMPALTGDVTTGAGTTTTTLANIPSGAPAVGTILHTNIAAPSTPASGKESVYTDLTDKRLHDKNDAGTIGTTVVSDTGSSNNFLTAVSSAGVISKAQPSFSNLSGNIAIAQINSGTSASATTFLRGDNTWVTPAGSGNVNNTGTPTAAQLATFTNATTIQGVTALPAANFPALTGDVTSSAGALATTLANIPTATPAAGSILQTAIAAPSTPAAGKGSVYVDSTSKALAVKNDAGAVSHTVKTKAAVANSFATAIADDGTVSVAQPAFTNLSGSVAAGQMPALTGDVTMTAGTTATTVVSVGGVPFANSATIDTTDLSNIPTGTLGYSRVAATRTHVAEAATITITLGNGIDYDSTASGTLTTIAFSGSPSGPHITEARIRLIVSSGPQTITIPTSRRVGNVGTLTSLSLTNGNHELSWISQPTGGGGTSLEYWLVDSGDDTRQAFSNVNVNINTGVRQVAQTGTLSQTRVATLPLASTYPNGTGFWYVDENGSASGTNKLQLTSQGSDTINGVASGSNFDTLTTAYGASFIQSDGSSKWTALNISAAAAGVSNTAFASSWLGVTGTAPSKNAVYNALHALDTDDDGKINVLDQGVGITNTDSGGVIQTAITAPAGAIVGTTDTQTLTNKSISSGQVTGLPTFPSGAIVGTTDTQTLTNKTLTSPTINSSTTDSPTVTGDPVGVLFAKKVSVNLLNTGTTNIYTVPGGKTALVIGVWQTCTAKTGSFGTHATWKIIESGAGGTIVLQVTNQSSDDTVNNTTWKQMAAPNTTGNFCAAGNSIQVSVTAAATGVTVLTSDFTAGIILF